MLKLKFWKIFLLLFELICDTFASTHWVVTEGGRIQTHLDSPFHLRRPYDLIALLDQEVRRTEINRVYNDLLSKRGVIDIKWSGLEGAQDLEARIHAQDINCLKAGKLLSEIELFAGMGSNGSSRVDLDLTIEDDEAINKYLQPECSNYSKLDFSMFSYDHLEGIVSRANVNVDPDVSLEYLLPSPSVDSFGHQIALELAKNNSSWINYNLGILFWRIKGNALQAIECARRALYYVSCEYKDIPLLNLAGLFHQSRLSNDAAILLQAAVDHAPHEATNYLALGNVYAVLSDYNKSVDCYDRVLKLQPDSENVITVKYATLCHRNLDSGLVELYESLKVILSQLHDYHGKQQQWLRLQERFVWEQAPLETQLEAQIFAYKSEKLNSMLTNYGQRCVQRTSEGSKSTITCDFIDHQTISNFVDVTSSLQKLLQNVESETQKISEQMARNKRYSKKQIENLKMASKILVKVDDVATSSSSSSSSADEEVRMPEMLHPVYPTTLSSSSNIYFDSSAWPLRDECVNWNLPLNEQDDLDIPVFLPPENKGFQITKMLTEYINLPATFEHTLPWYPPVCEHPNKDKEKAVHFPGFLRQLASTTSLKSHPYLQKHFLRYINDGKSEESEIGQRIITAMNKKSGPAWVLATIASMYWRVRLNTKNALNCLHFAFQTTPKEYTDVILVSIGSILHQLELIDDAIKFTTLAFKINYNEPSTNFLLALLHYKKNNPILAMYYMKNVLRIEPDYYDGKAEKLLKIWACRIKMGVYEETKVKTEKLPEGMCSEKDAFNGEGVICSANGEQCKTAAIQCFRADNVQDDSDTVTLDLNSKILSSQQCSKQKVGLGQSLISTLLAAEGSGGIEPDQSQLESLVENNQQAFHMRISLGDDHTPTGGNTLGDFYVSVSLTDDPVPEAMLHVYDKSGTYPLSPRGCRHIQDADWLQFTSMWQSIAARNVDIGPFLKPIPSTVKENLLPFCSDSIPTSAATLDHLTAMVLRKRLPNSPENVLSEWLGLMAGDQQASVGELGTKIEIALKENNTSWILATAAALYWRIVGNTEAAVTCLRQALTYVPNDMKDIPLISLANVLHRVGFHSDALEVAYVALESHPNFVVNHFTAGNIHTSLGDLEKAISFYRSSLALDAGFEPARNRLQALLCTLLFDESGSLRESTDISEE